CHKKPNETAQWAADAVKKWFGEKPNREPHWGPAIKAGRAAAPEGEKLLLDLVARKTTPSVVKATAIDLLTAYPSRASATARRDGLRSADPIVRLTAVQSLPDDNLEDFASDLASVIHDPVRAVRIAAGARLAQMPPESLSKLTDSQRNSFERAVKE